MTTIPTQNAVPSEAARDLKFNSGKIDEFVTSLEREYKDRFGRSHMTIEGMRWIFEQLMERFKIDMNQAIIAAGYIPMDSFQKGAEITLRNQILRDEVTGEYYRWDGDLPKSVPAGATPESAGGVGVGVWVSVGDAVVRNELESVKVTVDSLNGQYNNVSDLLSCDYDIGKVVETRGLRSVNDGGHAYYKIVSPNDSGIKITEYPNEFGDIKLSNGNVAKRISEIKIQDGVRYWAHRGGQRDVAENTLFSFQQAIDNGAYGVELDCSMSSDGIWYVYHDASLYLQTNGTDFFYNRDSAYIDSLTFNKMKSSVYGNYIRIPKFSDFLKWARNNGVPFTVEFKNPRPSSADVDIAAGIHMIVDAGCELQSHVQVTVDSLAYVVHNISNDITISYAISNLDNPDRDISQICRAFDKVIIQTNSNTINDSFAHGVKLALAMGSDVICYTGNDKEDDIKKILSVGVKNIISDRGWENK